MHWQQKCVELPLLQQGVEQDFGSGCSWLEEWHVELLGSWRLGDIDCSVATGGRAVLAVKLYDDLIPENRRKLGGEEQVLEKVMV
jgi:hypothetical protein